MATETLILDFQVDQGQALQDLKKAETAIIDLKQEQRELNTEYKLGIKTQEEYVEENIRVQRELKKEQENKRALNRALNTESNSRNAIRERVRQLNREYNNLNLSTEEGRKRSDALGEELKELNAQLNAGSKAAGQFKDNIGNYPELANQATVATDQFGIGLGGMSAKFAALANPVGAAIGLVGTFGAILARSRQTQDLFAQATAGISGAVDLLTKDLADLVFTSKEANKEFSVFSTAIDVALFRLFGSELQKAAAEAAKLERELQKVRISNLTDVRESNALLRDIEILKQLRDDDRNALADRLAANEEIFQIEQRRLELVSKGSIAELKIVQATIERVGRENAALELLEREKQLYDEITQFGLQSFRFRTAHSAAAERLGLELNKALEAQKALNEAERRAASGIVETTDTTGTDLQNEIDTNLRIVEGGLVAEQNLRERFANELEQLRIRNAQKERLNAKEIAEFAIQQEQFRAQVTSDILNSVGSLFDQESEEFKALALAETFINTYSAATAALAPPPLGAGPLFGPGLAAATIVAGLANAARIGGVQFAEGGYTGSGFGAPDSSGYKPAGIVHQNEYVVPSWQVTHPSYANLVGQLESGRARGYQDGGIVTAGLTEPINQELALSNALKNLPPAQLSVQEVSRVQDRIRMREKSSKI